MSYNNLKNQYQKQKSDYSFKINPNECYSQIDSYVLLSTEITNES
jgi:hypothetical protein